MGLFSNPKCPVHRTEYSIGTNGLVDYYYCRQCSKKAREERDEKLAREKEMKRLNDEINHLKEIVLSQKH